MLTEVPDAKPPSGGAVLATLLGKPWAVESFLFVAAGVARAVGDLHRRGFVHGDLQPSGIVVDVTTGDAQLIGLDA